jgi:hypothetical protein
MVRIEDYKKHLTDDGRDFLVLVVQGGIEMVKSKQSGSYYATVRKATIPSTFDELTCQSLIGTELPGNVIKVETEPYEYTIKETGEVLTLTHKWEFIPEEEVTTKVEKSSSTIDEFIQPLPQESFSLNEVE